MMTRARSASTRRFSKVSTRHGVKTEAEFTRRVQAAFTPDNNVFSGNLPALGTRSRALWKLYYTGFTNLLYSRVDFLRRSLVLLM